MGEHKLTLLFIAFFAIANSNELCSQKVHLSSDRFNSFYYEQGTSLWISSELGWDKLSNSGNELYQLNTVTGLKGSYIQSALHKDKYNDLWTSTYEHLCKYSKSNNCFNCEQLVYNETTLEKGYHVIRYEESMNSLLLKIENHLYWYELDQAQLTRLSEEPSNGIRFNIGLNPPRTIIGCPWLLDTGIEIWEEENGYWNKEILRFENCSFKREPTISQSFYYKAETWLISNIGLIKLDKQDVCKSQIFNPPNIDVIFSNGSVQDNNIFVTSEGAGLFVFDLQEEQFVKQFDSQHSDISLMSDRPVELFISKSQEIFLSHVNRGVEKFSVHQLLNNIQTGFKKDEEIKFIGNIKGSIVLITSYGIYNLYSGGILPVKTNANTFDFTLIEAITIGNDSQIYMANDKEIVKYDHVNQVVNSVFKGSEKPITSIVYKDDLYVISGYNLSKLNRLTKKLDKIDLGIYNNSIRKYFPGDSSKSYFVLNASDLLIREGNIDTLLKISHYINDILISPEGVLVGTNNGLFYVTNDMKISKLFEQQMQFFSSRMLSLESIEEGNVVNTNSGIYIINVNENVLWRLPFECMFSTNYETKVSYRNDTIFSAYDNKLYYYSNAEKPKLNQSKLLISESYCDDFIIESSSSTLELNYNFSELRLHYMIENDMTCNSCILEYNLDGREIINGNISMMDQLTIPRLLPGEYTLSSFAYDSYGQKTTLNKLNIQVLPPFHQTWWFRLLLGIALLGVGFGINYMLTKQKLKEKQIELDRQKALQEQRQKMSQDLHDEMGSGLSTIRYLTNAQSEFNPSKLKQIENLTTGLIGNLRDLLWSLDESNDTAINILARIRETTSQYCKNTKLDYSITETILDRNQTINGIIRRNIILILKEAIANTLKHAVATELSIDLKINAGRLNLSIQDDGIGFQESVNKANKQYGLKSIQHRAKQLGGIASFDSSTKGVLIEIDIPLKTL